MCGISGFFGDSRAAVIDRMVALQRHRGPDDQGVFVDARGGAALGHNRLSIIDLSAGGRQPMSNADGSLQIVFNGEVYNYLELRSELSDYPFTTATDTEVVLAAYSRWGAACLDRFIGMFAFLIWDSRRRRLFAARDRFGVKPLYYATEGAALFAASEIKSIHEAGVPAIPDEAIWAAYFCHGLIDHSERTFWKGVRSLPPGHLLHWQDGRLSTQCWYSLPDRAGADFDTRPEREVEEEYRALLEDAVRLRFRSDVPVGINLSGGLDSSILLALVNAVQGADDDTKAFTFVTGDPRYDELPWVARMLERTHHRSVICRLHPEDVPALATSVQEHQDEPFGGLPTLAYARLFERAREEGAIVLLDGQGMDEQWAGYDYYAGHDNGRAARVQGAKDRPVRPDCLTPEFRSLAEPLDTAAAFPDPLRNRQYRDVRHTKIPRALRFNDRVSMRSSTELREPFLDHRLFELAFRQRPDYKIRNGVHKWLLRRLAAQLAPGGVVEAPKRALQTPQREWLRGPLRGWAQSCIEQAIDRWGGAWLDENAVRSAWRDYCAGHSDNSFYVWQWISVGLQHNRKETIAHA